MSQKKLLFSGAVAKALQVRKRLGIETVSLGMIEKQSLTICRGTGSAINSFL